MVIMMICDAGWIRLNMALYTENIMAIQNTGAYTMRYAFALPIYAVMYISVIFIAVPLHAIYDAGSGALVGCSIYGVYNLCVLLQFENSSVPLACLDTAWGIILFTGVTRLAVAFDTVLLR
jgi:uncharacterized membrane protein